MTTNIGEKIETYASKNMKILKQEEIKTGKKFTKYDIALFMLSKGELNKSDFASWMNTNDGFQSLTLSEQQKKALKQGNVWNVAGFGNTEESYLDSLIPFSEKSDIEKVNLLYSQNQDLDSKDIRARKMQEHLANFKKLDVKKDLQDNEIRARWNSLPEVTATYTELMNSIKFKQMSKEEQVEFLLRTAGENFNKAKEAGNKAAMKDYLYQGIGLIFQKLDNDTGITKFKDWIKENSGLNSLVDYIDSKVDNNSAEISTSERIWENIKGIGDFADSLIGTQGIAMIGAFMLLGEAVAVSATSTLSEAAAAKVITGFQALLTSYFGVEGGKLVYDGVVENLNASSKDEIRAAGQKLGSGAFMLYGAGKGGKQVYQNVKSMYQASQVQAANQQALADARKTLGLDDNVDITEASLKSAKKAMTLKNHPDKGGSVEAMQEINAAYDLLKASLSSSPKTASKATTSSNVNNQDVASNTPIRYTQTEQVNATKITYQLINNGNAIMSYKDNSGKLNQVLEVPEGTIISTPNGYKKVGKGEIVVKTNNSVDIKDMLSLRHEYSQQIKTEEAKLAVMNKELENHENQWFVAQYMHDVSDATINEHRAQANKEIDTQKFLVENLKKQQQELTNKINNSIDVQNQYSNVLSQLPTEENKLVELNKNLEKQEGIWFAAQYKHDVSDATINSHRVEEYDKINSQKILVEKLKNQQQELADILRQNISQEPPSNLLKPEAADNIKGQGISFK